MTDNERQRLLDCMPLAPSPFRSRHFKQTLIAEFLGVFLVIGLLVWVKQQPAAFVIPTALVCYAIWWLLHLKSRILNPRRRWREANRKVLEFHNAVAAARTVRVHCVQSDTVVQVTYDEGTVCLFEIDQSRTFWVDPYSMIPGSPPKNWPSGNFEIVEVPGWLEQAGPFCSGKRLRPRETVEFRDLFEHDDFQPPQDGFIDQPLDAFLKDAAARKSMPL